MSTKPRSAPERLQEGLQRLGIHPVAWERYRPRGARGGAGGADRPQSALRVEGSEVFLEGPIIAADDEWIMDWLGITAYVTAGVVRDALAKIDGAATLVVNSPGGDVFEAASIVDTILEREADVDARVSGLAASAAAGLLLFAKRVECSPMSMVMFHRAWALAVGNAKEFAAFARLLDKVDRQLAGQIAGRVEGMDEAQALALLDGPEGQDGTWLTAQEAVDQGIADAVSGTDEPDPAMGSDDDDEELADRMRSRMRLAFSR